ncbi:MAG: hypothetical protein V1740_00270 [Candidatus Woesearchaeota archaeon]
MADKVPDHIKEYHKKRRKAEALANAIERHGRMAYDHAAEMHLKTDDGGIDIERLDEEPIQDKFAKSMTDFYVSKAKQQFKSEIPDDDEFKKSLLLKAYGQHTYDELKQILAATGSDLTFDKYKDSMKKMQDEVRGRLRGISLSHFKKDHIDDIVKYTRSGEFVDKGRITLDEAKNLLETYKQVGTVSPKAVRHEPYAKEDYYKKKKKEAA